MFSLKINGFRSEAEARAFIKWYEGQGEQDAQIWFENLMEHGQIDRDFIGVDVHKPYIVEESSAFPEEGYNTTLVAWVEE